jgi:stearoyl-CoA desaturase (delta-9 desaturase)
VAVPPERVDWLPNLPFFLLHLSVPAVFLVGWSPVALWTALGLYVVRMFFITAFYHRYFSHKAYRVSRPVQFLMSAAGATAVQRGALWWAAHHRFHHAHSDEDVDSHSPRHGFWWSHMFWFLTKSGSHTRERLIPDFRKFPELFLMERWFLVPPLLLAAALFAFGELAAARWPQLGTTGWQMFVWGFGVSTVALYHGTYTINSVSHVWGKQRYETGDTSRNNWLLALVTLGEGWHNNHHHFSASARQGFYWWEIDISWYGLWVLEKLRIVRDLKPVPDYIRDERPRAAGRGSPA